MVDDVSTMLYQIFGTPSHNLGATKLLQQNEEIQFSAYASRQFNSSNLPFENDGNKESFCLSLFLTEIWE